MVLASAVTAAVKPGESSRLKLATDWLPFLYHVWIGTGWTVLAIRYQNPPDDGQLVTPLAVGLAAGVCYVALRRANVGWLWLRGTVLAYLRRARRAKDGV